jgi:uncharacterized phage-associated protein
MAQENPNTVSVFDVAAYILQKKGEMTTMKLQKLIYYCQAWSLVWDEKPLFKEKIEAWISGPVVRNLYNWHKNMFTVTKIPGTPSNLTKTQKATINAVLDYYGDKNSQWLSDLSHMEEPWKKAREGLPPNERGDHIISHASMAEYYSSL